MVWPCSKKLRLSKGNSTRHSGGLEKARQAKEDKEEMAMHYQRMDRPQLQATEEKEVMAMQYQRM